MSSSPKLLLLTSSTPNGHKVTIALEELGLKYEVRNISLPKNEQKEDWFLKVNPNGRIPALVDQSRNDFPVFESAAILHYLSLHYDPESKFHFADDVDDESEMIQWMFFSHGGLGPMQGQANHFVRYAPEKIPYAQTRYINETKRLYSVYDDRLKGGREYLAGKGKGKYTWADVVAFSWIRCHEWSGIPSIDEWKNLKAWFDRIDSRDAVKKGVAVPEKDTIAKLKEDPSIAEKHAKAASDWIMKGNKK